MTTSSLLNVSCSSTLLGLPSGCPKNRFVAANYAEGEEFNLTQQERPESLTGTLVSAAFSTVLALGLTSFALARLLSSELYDVSPADPCAFLAAAFLMILVSLLPSYTPTQRAMWVDQLAALRRR
jgi:hypothetical protein